MIGIAKNIKSSTVVPCTTELLREAITSPAVADICARIMDALESRRRGELSADDFETVKRQLKAGLPIITPHATFRNGRRVNADATPSGLSMYDKDHIADPEGYWNSKRQLLQLKTDTTAATTDPAAPPSVLDRILMAHITPSGEGLRLIFAIPDGMDLTTAQRWMAAQLEDSEYDTCVKDLARPSFLVPRQYILYINEEELLRDRTTEYLATMADGKADDTSTAKATTADASTDTAKATTADADTGRHFPDTYENIPYATLTEKLVELLGGQPEHGSRNTFLFSLACYLRYVCDDDPAWIKHVIPTFGEATDRAYATVDSACNRKQPHRMPVIVSKAIDLCRKEAARGRSADYDAADYGDTANPSSFFYDIHQMPQKLPRLIRLLTSKSPAQYRPAVAQAVFPPLATHLCNTRFRYIDNVEHEATMMSILCAPTGSGKECITEPINRIMADIRQRDEVQRQRERQWKDECSRKGSNKDRRERPEGLVIQEVNIDMTNPAFVLRMKEAEQHFLYAKVNELNLFDTLKGKTNQHFRIMELAFDLGTYGQDRVGLQSVTETVHVRFNWNACCTPKKCRDYFRRVVTDGPVSRIAFATIEQQPCGAEIPVYGTYDAAFDEELRPYIDNLVKARGLVDCPQALKLARTLMEENAEFSRLSQNRVFENLSYRANVIAYLKACVLYVANGMKWEKQIEDFVRWSERYDLWCKLRLFGQMIYDADAEDDKQTRTAPYGPKNLLTLLPDEFTLEDYIKVRREQGFDDDGVKPAKNAVNQWVHRGYVVKTEVDDDNYNYSSIFRKLKYKTNS